MRTRTIRVAIIGASYAGLTLANVLQQHNESNTNQLNHHNIDDDDDNITCHFDYTVFESKSPPFSYIIGGDFNIPSYPMILDRLQLHHQGGKGVDTDTTHAHTHTHTDTDTCTFERKDVIDTLRNGIERNISYGTHIISIEDVNVDVEVEVNSDSTRTCMSTTRKCNCQIMLHSTSSRYNYQEGKKRKEQNQRHGPFDIVVGANGVKSLCRNRNEYRDRELLRIYIIGDARWVNDRFYDLGFRRIDQGADIAMRDGLELGKYLTTRTRPSNMKMEEKFHAKYVRIRQFQRRMILFVLLITLIMKIAHAFIKNI